MRSEMRHPFVRRAAKLLVGLVCAWFISATAARGTQLAENAGAPPDGPRCGNGVLEPGEGCESCPTDCTVRPCAAGSGSYRLEVVLTTPPSARVAAATLLVTYRAGTVRLPGKGSAPSVRERVQVIPSDTFAAVNDRGYALRVALARPAELRSGRLLDVAFDTCGGETPPRVEDFSCIVEGCGGHAGLVAGCTCSVSPAPESLATAR